MTIQGPEPDDNVLANLAELDDWIGVGVGIGVVATTQSVVAIAVHRRCCGWRVFQTPSFQQFSFSRLVGRFGRMLVIDIQPEGNVHGSFPSLQNGSVVLCCVCVVFVLCRFGLCCFGGMNE